MSAQARAPRARASAEPRSSGAEAPLRRASGAAHRRARRLAALAAARATGCSARASDVLLSYRNRELVNLVVVAVITGLGFASVYIARQDVVSTGSLSYALFFFALYLAAHVVARIAVPQADPYLLPMAALLTAIGVTEIYRLDPDDAFRQGAVDRGRRRRLRRRRCSRLRHDYRRLESYKYLFGLGGDRAAHAARAAR